MHLLGGTEPEIVDNADRKSLRVEIVGTKNLMPELVIILATRRESVPEPDIHTAARLEDNACVVLVVGIVGKIDAADSQVELSKRTVSGFAPPLIDRTAPRGGHAV